MPERLAEVKAYATVTDSGCWEWPKLDRKGYPRNITLATASEPAHRAVLTAVLGRPLGAEAAHHTCANRACVNPDHLQPVTAAENTAEMLERRAYRARIAELERKLADLAS
ncbi:HNH endonuclease [Rhodococcus erythropolis]|uniref:HNH endonuclease n=1 Tax=Rhodococcus erythropolis TaxID=1833 RepID=A0A8I1DAT5_RHOER|nr:HNH endonuclease [Rhodococcus erythropolis]